MISIVIPAYNAEKYIKKNYEALSTQLDKEFEIIYIDDGSNDKTLQYLDEIRERDNRVKVLSQLNSGAMVARMNGVQVSKYEYITFLDVDDTVSSSYIFSLKESICDGYDLVSTGFVIKSDNKNLKKNNIDSGVYSKEEYLYQVLSKSSWELCGKAFNKKLFQGVGLPDRRLSVAEDTYIFVQVLLNIKTKVIVTDTFNYFYHVVENSISRQKNNLFVEDALYVGLTLKKILIDYNVNIDYINCMILLLYSNSLRRGMLSSKHQYFKVVQDAFKLDALILLPKHKMIFVIIGFIANKVLK